ncbi:hypothetical protein CsSME_00027696 [Camellia sinensis var. sinensis]
MIFFVRSGSDTAVGPRRWNEDEHLLIDDVSSHLGSLYTWPLPNASFYAVFDGHGGSQAATYLKDNAMRFFFEDVDLPPTDDDDSFFKELEDSHRRAFLRADRALADDSSLVASDCGTTALTALVVGRHLLVANAGDCRAVLCRNGVALQISNDHRPTYLPERQRVEELGGTIKFGYLNGELAVTRALGDWHLKRPFGSASPLTAEPDIHRILLTEEDEFLILACDGVWDVMSNEEAVDIVRNQLRQHRDPQQCARELVDHASGLCSKDNLTAIVVCFSNNGNGKRPAFHTYTDVRQKRKTAFI